MTKKKERKLGDYEVGYCRPPKHTQWKKGQQANPGGAKPKNDRARTELQFCDDLLKMLEEIIPITVGGKRTRLTRNEALNLSKFNKAIAGDWRARRELAQERKWAIEGNSRLRSNAVKLVEKIERSLAENPRPLTAEEIKLMNMYRRKTRGDD